MLNDQVIGLLQNNAGNPDIVRRIAEENRLSQAEIAQALRIPDGSAARYVSGMNPDQGPGVATIDNGMASKPAMGGAVPQKPGGSMAAPVGSAGGELDDYGSFIDFYARQRNQPQMMQKPAVGEQIPPRQIINQPGGGMRQQEPSGADIMRGGVSPGGMSPGVPVKPGSLGNLPNQEGRPVSSDVMTKPAKLPPDMKPQGLRGEFRQVRPPSNTAIPEDEMAFSRGFERIRGARA
jgi:hypothetical protein